MTDRELMKLALEAAEVLETLFKQAEAMHEEVTGGVNVHCQITVADLSKGLYAAAAIREALAEQPAQPYKGIADHTNQATNGRLKIDPVTGDVGIGTPIAEPVQEPVAYIEHHKAAGEE